MKVQELMDMGFEMVGGCLQYRNVHYGRCGTNGEADLTPDGAERLARLLEAREMPMVKVVDELPPAPPRPRGRPRKTEE